MPSTARSRRAPIRATEPYRQTVDYAQLFAGGARLSVQGYEASLLSEPLDATDAVLVLLVRVPQAKLDAVKTHGLSLLDLWHRWGPMVLGMLRSG